MSLVYLTIGSMIVLPSGQSQAQSAASILPNARTQILDNNGKPLVSGTVDYYIPGTTTRKTTWQDSGKTVANTNPVVLDGGGRALMLGDGSYRQVVKDRLGNIIWDQVTNSSGSGGGGGSATVGDGQPVGSIQLWAGMVAPAAYAFSYGQEFTRASFPELFAALTSQQNVSCTLGSNSLTGLSNTQNIPIGSPVESTCLNSGATVTAKTVSTVTTSSNAIITTNTSARFFPYGNGDGSTTFNAPDLRGKVPVGRCNMGGIDCTNLSSTYYGSTPSAIGANGGNQSRTLGSVNLPNYSLNVTASGTASVNSTISTWLFGLTTVSVATPGANINVPTSSGVVSSTGTASVTGTTSSINGNQTQLPFSVIPPSITTNYVIKITPDSNPNSFFGVASIGGMTGVINCGFGLTCAGNTISAINSLVPAPTPINLGGVYQSNAPANQFAIGVDLAGNILYSGGSTTVNGQVCTIGSSCTITASAGAITVGTTSVSSGTTNGLLFNNAGVLGNIAPANNSVLATNGSGIPSWNTTLPSGLTIPSAVHNGGVLSGTFTGTPTFSGSNFISNSNLNQVGATTIKGNPSASTANASDFTIQGLVNSTSPNATSDYLPIYDSATNTIKRVTPALIASAGAAGVSSFGGATGVITTKPSLSVVSNAASVTDGVNGVWAADYGAKCDGVTNDTTALQNAWNAASNLNTYMNISGIGTGVCVFSSLTAPAPTAGEIGKRAGIVGGGASNSVLRSTVTGTSCAINISLTYGTNSYYEVPFQDFALLQTTTGARVGRGLCLTGVTAFTMRNVYVGNFDVNILATDSIRVNIFGGTIYRGTIGLYAAYSSFSRPNAWNVQGVAFSENTQNAIYLDAPTQFNIGGNTFETNGTNTGLVRSTILVNGNPVDGRSGVDVFDNYFEGNGGDADVNISDAGLATVGIHRVRNNTFNRYGTAPSNYVSNNIRNTVSGSSLTRISISGNSFFGTSTYTPSAARPYWGTFGNPNATIFMDEGNNLFGSPVETPPGAGALYSPGSTANGYTRLPGGFILQWGTVNATGAGAAVTFPVAFPLTVSSVTISAINGAAAAVGRDNPTLSGFNAFSSGASVGASWMAIGR